MNVADAADSPPARVDLALTRNNFDLLRFIFASAVIYSHSYFLLHQPGDFVEWWTHKQSFTGELAVDGFFAISGYLIAISWLRSRGVVDFLRKRVLRIYPAFIAMTVLCLFVFAPLIVSSFGPFLQQQSWPSVIKHMLTLQGPSPAGFTVPKSFDHVALNGSMWTIRIEFECYLLTLLLGLCGVLRRPKLLLALFLALWLLQSALALGFAPPELLYKVVPRSAFMAHPRLVSYYMAGTLGAAWSALVRPRWWAALAAFAALALTGWLGGFAVVAPIAFSCLVFAAAFPGKPDFSRFASRGDMSYGIYLYAWPLQQLFVSHWAESLSPTGLTAIVFACTVVLAALSWRLVERPALSLKRTGVPGVHSPGTAVT